MEFPKRFSILRDFIREVQEALLLSQISEARENTELKIKLSDISLLPKTVHYSALLYQHRQRQRRHKAAAERLSR